MTWDWQQLEILNGDATGVPPVLDKLLHGSRSQRAEAFSALDGKVVNQGDLFSSAAAVTDVILAELRLKRYLHEEAWLILHEIYRGSSSGRSLVVDDERYEVEEYCRCSVLSALPVIDEVVMRLDGEDFSYAAFLLGDIGEDSDKAIAILEREIAKSSGPRLDSAMDQLEVAVDLAEERRARNKTT
ncbi:hypothetical protein ABZW11_28680 [Nonomuraea sp. NPDC004580]|uniref:hypothetical protein n=1 Tax=Nonomuraea sp. NPDC004580 TaxID=3154552 RepID=UPI0033B34379